MLAILEENEKPKWPKHKDHLNKTYLEELAYKLWSTKGTRFVAAERLLTMNNLSGKANGFLSAYLIIYGLFSVYQITGSEILDPRIIAFSSTTLAILLLVFTQLETAQDYKTRALGFHNCALALSALHDQIRLFKTLKKPTDEEKIIFSEKTSEEYQKILSSYPNHDNIDFKYFQTKHKDYYGLSSHYKNWIAVYYYWRTKFLYHALIGFPFVILVLLLIVSY